jgi:hypothetical protein
MDLAKNAAQTGRDTGFENFTYEVWHAQANDVLSLSSLYPDGFPGVAIDTKNARHFGYTNNIASSPTATAHDPTPTDNTDLPEPTGPLIFLANEGHDAGVLGNFVRISVDDIDPDPADNRNRRGVWLQKVYTGEDCTNKSFRWFLCSPLFRDP